ncbi:hypothetical protein Tco_1513841, partial [Tanacetum coccineum]
TVMSDSKDSTITYTEVVLQAPLSPDYVPGLEEPEQAPPLPNFIPEPVYPEFMPLEDESDSKEDLEEDPADYPADGGDDGDDEDESSDDDKDDDVDIEGDEEEDEHPAPADSTTVAFSAVEHALSTKETEPFETDESAATPPPHPAYRIIARMSIRDKQPTPFWSEADIARLLAIPSPPPSPLSPWSSPLPQIPLPPLPVSSPVPGICGHDESCCTIYLYLSTSIFGPRYKVGESSSAPTARPNRDFRRDYGFITTLDDEIMRDPERDVNYGIIDTWDEILVGMLGAPTTDKTELGQRVIDLVMTVRHDIDEIYGRLDDAQTELQMVTGRVNMLFKDRRAHARTARLMKIKARMS